MAKDPRFNFYPDNYLGGTLGFTLEQHGAYLQLLILNSKIGKFTEQQAIDHLISLTRGNTAVATELWRFLLPKFTREGQLFFSERLFKEIEKSKRFSEKQSERVKNRYKSKNKENTNQSGTHHGSTAVLPDNISGIGNGIDNDNERIGGAGERKTDLLPDFTDYESWTDQIIQGTDLYWPQIVRNSGLHINGQLTELARSHLALLAKYPKMCPSDQHRFRISLIGHCAEKIKEQPKQHKQLSARELYNQQP